MKVQEFKEELDALIERNPWVKNLKMCIPCDDGNCFVETGKDFPLIIAKGILREHHYAGNKVYTNLKHYDDLYSEKNYARNFIKKEDCNIVIITY